MTENKISLKKEYENLINISIKNNLIFNNFPRYIFERMYRIKIINLENFKIS